jgi:hypothetical protein
MMNYWQAVFFEPAKGISFQIMQFVTSLLLVLIILVIGWIISLVIKAGVTKALRLLRLDDLSDTIALDKLLAKGGIQASLSELVGIICYWLSLLITFVVAFNAAGLTIAADLLNKVVLYVPNVIAAIFILILGMFAANILKTIVQTTANNAGLPQVNLLSRLVEIIVIVFAIAISLEQLNIGARIIASVVTIVLGSFGLAIGLAFGLGCKDMAAKFVAELIENLKTKK